MREDDLGADVHAILASRLTPKNVHIVGEQTGPHFINPATEREYAVGGWLLRLSRKRQRDRRDESGDGSESANRATLLEPFDDPGRLRADKRFPANRSCRWPSSSRAAQVQRLVSPEPECSADRRGDVLGLKWKDIGPQAGPDPPWPSAWQAHGEYENQAALSAPPILGLPTTRPPAGLCGAFPGF